MNDFNHNNRIIELEKRAEWVTELEKRLDELERTVAGLQVLLGKASEYRARPKRGRLPR